MASLLFWGMSLTDHLILEQWISNVLWLNIRSWFICFQAIQVKGVKNALARAAVCDTHSQAAGTHQQVNLLCFPQ